MHKVEVIARRVLGWRMNRVNKWFNIEDAIFIEDFNPIANIDHAMMIVHKLELFGFKYTQQDDTKVCFSNDFVRQCESGETLGEAITNAAFAIAEVNTISEEWL